MTISVAVYWIWALVTAIFAMAMTMRELDTGRARAHRLDDSALDPDSVKWSGAAGLLVALLLCLITIR